MIAAVRPGQPGQATSYQFRLVISRIVITQFDLNNKQTQLLKTPVGSGVLETRDLWARARRTVHQRGEREPAAAPRSRGSRSAFGGRYLKSGLVNHSLVVASKGAGNFS